MNGGTLMIHKESEVENGDCESTTKSTKKVAKELLKNGILIETNKGLVCLSLKDALNSEIGGHNLSVEDFHTVTAQLLYQEKPKRLRKVTPCNLTTHSSSLNVQFKVDLKNFRPANEERMTTVEKSMPNFSEFSFSQNGKSVMKEKMTKFDLSSLPLEGAKKNKTCSTKRSLIIQRNMKSVISVQNILRNMSKKINLDSHVNNMMLSSGSALMKNRSEIDKGKDLTEICISCEETSDNSEATYGALCQTSVKKRGGWPKGRKRKPETKYEIRPPKAPATGYVIFLNKRRKEFRDIPFTEVTKLLGNEWSKLSLDEKRVYLDQAEVEKKRYREELRLYRQSDAYRMYLQKKRLKKLQGNGTEESDMDATDEIDDEDNEELYCRTCDQWFHSLHNKKEHLYGRQHLQSLGCRYNKRYDPDWCNANMSSTSLDESSLDGSFYLKKGKEHCCNRSQVALNMDDVIVGFMLANKEREEERVILRKKLTESKAKNEALTTDLQQLNEVIGSLTCMAESERTTQILLEQRLFNLLNVPTLFYLPEPLSEGNNE